MSQWNRRTSHTRRYSWFKRNHYKKSQPDGGWGSINPNKLVTFEFPIANQEHEATLKNIHPLALPNFYGLITKDLDTFIFEFVVLCWIYDYTTNAWAKNISSHTKICIFKVVHGVGKNAMENWGKMRGYCLKKYQFYHHQGDMKIYDILWISRKEDEPLKCYVERFQLCLKNSH